MLITNKYIKLIHGMLSVAVYAYNDDVMSVMGCGLLWRRAVLGLPSVMNGC